MSIRCDHGFYASCCTDSECKHYDGTGNGAGPIETRFVYCTGCEEAIERDAAIRYHNGWKCPGCALCLHCKKAPRPKQSRYCRPCFAELSAPKECSECRRPMHCKQPAQKYLTHHIKRNKHLSCSIDVARVNSRRTFL